MKVTKQRKEHIPRGFPCTLQVVRADRPHQCDLKISVPTQGPGVGERIESELATEISLQMNVQDGFSRYFATATSEKWQRNALGNVSIRIGTCRLIFPHPYSHLLHCYYGQIRCNPINGFILVKKVKGQKKRWCKSLEAIGSVRLNVVSELEFSKDFTMMRWIPTFEYRHRKARHNNSLCKRTRKAEFL
ncbi:hypothetical protein PoB_007091600 [Plakobranchus ocellatus]|uniref:Uncharacterized protein n=1 Tax=Plakobranchus ocellatus TaxID=259542 RepID=A0AAV4DKB6_9GAST|nr:hypothetical protein PoB_007091600 [Plakobranchus ocellatus]